METVCREFRYRGRLLVRFLCCQPVLEDGEEINDFYRQMTEQLITYAETLAHERETILLSGERALRMTLREIFLRYMARVTYLDEKYVSILWEYSRWEKGNRPEYARIAQTFSLAEGILLPPTAFLSGKNGRVSPDAPYYLTEEGVVFL